MNSYIVRIHTRLYAGQDQREWLGGRVCIAWESDGHWPSIAMQLPFGATIWFQYWTRAYRRSLDTMQHLHFLWRRPILTVDAYNRHGHPLINWAWREQERVVQ